MNDLMGFEFGGHPVRVVMVDGEPWWVAKDVCEVLGYASAGSNVTQILQRLDNDEKARISIPSNNNPVANFNKPVWSVNEAGLYALILWAQVPAAKEFQRWVTHDVLPQIRKTGTFGIPQTYAEALQLAADQARQLEEAMVKVEAYDDICDAAGTFALSDTAKNLGWGPKRFCKQLRADSVLFYRDQGSDRVNIPYDVYLDRGWFVVRTLKLDPLRQQTRVTGRGVLELSQRYHRESVQERATTTEGDPNLTS